MKKFWRKAIVALTAAAMVASTFPVTIAAANEWEYYAHFTTNTTFNPPQSGTYRIICVGKSGDGGDGAAGGYGNFNYERHGYTGGSGAGGSSGAIAISDLQLTKGTSYKLTFTGGEANFNDQLRAEAGADGGDGDRDKAGLVDETNAKAYGGNVVNREGYPGGQGGGIDDRGYTITPEIGGNNGGKLSNTEPSGYKGGGGARYPDIPEISKYLKPALSFVPDDFCGGGGYGRENTSSSSTNRGPSHGGDGKDYLKWRDNDVVLTGGGGGGASGGGQSWSSAGSSGSAGPGQGGLGGEGQPAIIIIERQADQIPPTVTDVTVPSAWTFTAVNVTVKATDIESGIAQYAVTSTNQKPSSGWQGSNTFKVTANGTYYAWAKDQAGNVSAGKQFKVSNIDTTAPIVSSVSVPSTWGQTLTVTVNATDTGSGIAQYGLTQTAQAPSSWQSSNTFKITANGTYYAWAKDAVGNVSVAKAFSVTKIDKTPPTIQSVTMPEQWGITLDITINATDTESGVLSYGISQTNSAPSAWQPSNKFVVKSNGTYYAWAKDAVGNVSISKMFSITKIDDQPPIITDVTEQADWGKTSSVTITAEDAETSIAGYTYTTTSSAPSISTSWQSINQLTVSKNGDYFAWVKDVAGNISSSKAFSVTKVDDQAPIVTMVKSSETWGQVASVQIIATDLQSGVTDYALTNSMAEPQLVDWNGDNNFEVTANGTYYAWAKDAVGNVSASKSIVIEYVDTTPPTIDNCTISDDTNTASITASDTGGSGLKGISVNGELFNDNPLNYTIVDGTAELIVQAVDNAGNESIIVKKPVPDIKPPKIDSVTFNDDGDEIIVTIIASDTGSSGLKGVFINGQLELGSPIFYTVPIGTKYLELQAVDNAGNKSTEILKKRVPGWNQVTNMVQIKSVNFNNEITQATIFATSSEADSEITGIYVDDILYEGNPITYDIIAGKKYLKLQAINNFGDKSEIVNWRIPGWWEIVDTLTIDPVVFSKNNTIATITAKNSLPGVGVSGIYVNDTLYEGNPITYTIPNGVNELKMQAENDLGDRSAVYTVTVPGSISDDVAIVSIDFNSSTNPQKAIITAASQNSEIAGILVNDALYNGNPVNYQIPEGTKHIKAKAISDIGTLSEEVIKRVPGWSQIVDTVVIKSVQFNEDNSMVEVYAEDLTGKQIYGVYVNDLLVEGNPAIYTIPADTKTLKLQAVNEDGDLSAIVNKLVPGSSSNNTNNNDTGDNKDDDNGTSLKLSIQNPGWTNQSRVKVRITASDKYNEIDDIEATSDQSSDWSDVTSSKYIYITEDTTVYARATNSAGETKEISRDIECFDFDPPLIAASLDGDYINVRVTDEKSGVKKLCIANNTYSSSETRGIIQYKISASDLEDMEIYMTCEDNAGNVKTSIFPFNDDTNRSSQSKANPHTGF